MERDTMFMNWSPQFCSDVLLAKLVYKFSAITIQISTRVEIAGQYQNLFGYAKEQNNQK